MFGVPLYKNVAPLDNFQLTGLECSQINKKAAQLISELRIQ